ncbi:unnamed protein product [Darwinula stevensoni]|uniref:Peptidase S1 domain-containing protein n=1 Tax=Darwinula stevensoni TaxID=69355 RepID=A0A7R9A1M8_9CRUS|nr:unnamed protein product [Darwinula stevensoni]CAG0888046.1 unnamed protein product [Darwinula stevensoni]
MFGPGCLTFFLCAFVAVEAGSQSLGSEASTTPRCDGPSPPEALDLASVPCGGKALRSWKWPVPLPSGVSLSGIWASALRQMGLIVHGEDAAAGEFPFIATLNYNYGSQLYFICGCNIISDLYVVTAAHCSAGPASSYTVKIRKYDIRRSTTTKEDSQDQTIAVDAVFVHPSYNSSLLRSGHDIALMRLKEKIQWNAYAQPICVAKTDDEAVFGNPETRNIIYGWGRLYTGGPVASNLQKLDVKIMDQKTCYDKGNTLATDGRLVCILGIPDDVGGACNGDSGGPLATAYRSTAYLTGLTSYTMGTCAIQGVPDVYTRLSYFADWIYQYVKGSS